MRYVAAYMLASLGGGKDSPSASDIEKILSSVGIECDNEKLKLVVDQMKGKSVEELVAQGQEKLASMPAGGGAGVAATAAAAPAAPAAAEKKEEKKPAAKEESDVSDDDMGFGLFD